ncbi:tryptophan 7-halogenase [Shewanella sp. AS16]|uniref:tryptophan halogenase family protein n=1 Tax=Shewanella sp. AS16 TaxID=2907625 RepID=UPI001F1F8CDA|nr:tryptophan halogenase family protein [Shewanella sp. AS16]MCE9687224.1 tryptophan 7-halogenase [Shewanella sp. AS16]
MHSSIKKLVIVGGGTSGWMAAAMLSRLLGKQLQITLVESDEIGTVGVGEASIPPLQLFNNVLGIAEDEFLKATQGTFKLGIEFEHWGQTGDAYMHAFGHIGKDLGFTPFHQYWLSLANAQPSDFWQYSLNYLAAKHNKFQRLDSIEGTGLAGLTHAYHFDAGLYAAYLRKYSEKQGVKRIEGKLVTTQLAEHSGNIASVTLASGQIISGDLFIDCSGFRALLIEQALETGYEDWRHWLPCDTALAIPSEASHPIPPYTKSIAHEAGWQWRIPLQHRTGNGLVYCSRFLSDEAATELLLSKLDGKPLAEPKKISFITGRRRLQWHKNCVALGLASGFLEPLESTSLHLVQSGIMRLLKLFPTAEFNQANIDEYNRQSKAEFEQVRDFIILHYRLNRHEASPFWQHCQTMDIPETLQHRIDLFRASGIVFRHQDELFSEAAWVQVMLGQGINPEQHHPLTDTITKQQLTQYCADLRHIYDSTANRLQRHEDYLAQHCQAPRV